MSSTIFHELQCTLTKTEEVASTLRLILVHINTIVINPGGSHKQTQHNVKMAWHFKMVGQTWYNIKKNIIFFGRRT
jgi:hypothetical protein